MFAQNSSFFLALFLFFALGSCARCKQSKIPTFRRKKLLDSRNNTQQQRERFFSNFSERWEAAAAHDDSGCGYGFEKYMFSLCVCTIRLCCFFSFSLHNIHIPLTRRAVVQHSCIHTLFVSSLSLSRTVTPPSKTDVKSKKNERKSRRGGGKHIENLTNRLLLFFFSLALSRLLQDVQCRRRVVEHKYM